MATNDRSGLFYGIGAYLLWGLFPLYFALFAGTGAFEVVAHRAFWSLIFCLILLTLTRNLRQVMAVFADRRVLGGLALAGVLIATNWSLYIFGVLTGRTLDAALGYFINPLAVAALGVVVLGERLRPVQWLAFGLGMAAVIVLISAYGEFPWIALSLALTFAVYGLVKKVAGRSVGAVVGLAVETLAILPLSGGYLAWLSWSGQTSTAPWSSTWLLLATTGIVTAIPLLFFAAAARRLTLVTIGMLQYIAPSIQFLIGWLWFNEPMPTTRWIGFCLVWAAVGIFAADALRQHRHLSHPRRPRPG